MRTLNRSHFQLYEPFLRSQDPFVKALEVLTSVGDEFINTKVLHLEKYDSFFFKHVEPVQRYRPLCGEVLAKPYKRACDSTLELNVYSPLGDVSYISPYLNASILSEFNHSIYDFGYSNYVAKDDADITIWNHLKEFVVTALIPEKEDGVIIKVSKLIKLLRKFVLRSFGRYRLDLRSKFRHIIRFLFKNMDDNSGENVRMFDIMKYKLFFHLLFLENGLKGNYQGFARPYCE